MARTTSPTAPASSRANPRLSHRQAVAWITGAGLLVRGLLLGAAPLWTDEAFMGVVVRRPFAAMIDVVHNDNHPPLQYLLDRLAVVVHDSPGALRLPSLVAGTAAVPIAMALGRRLGGDRAAQASGLTVAFMPLLVLWSRDARMYALATTMVLAMALALWRAVEQPSRSRLAVYFVVTVVALYSQYFVALAVVAQLGAALLFLRPPRGVAVRLLAAAAAAGLTLLPWLLYAAPQFRHAGDPYWIQPLALSSVLPGLADLVTHPGPTSLVDAAALIGIPLATWLAVRAYRRSEPGARQGFLFLLGSGGFALTVLAVVSLKKPLLDERFTNLFTTELLPIAGAALAATRRRWVLGAVVLALAAVTIVQESTLPTPDVPAILAPIAGHVEPGRDVVALNGPYHYFQVLYYGDPGTRASARVVATSVPWYFGLAGFRVGDIVPSVPDPSGTLYLLNDPGQGRPDMPADLHLARRQCAKGTCMEAWTH